MLFVQNAISSPQGEGDLSVLLWYGDVLFTGNFFQKSWNNRWHFQTLQNYGSRSGIMSEIMPRLSLNLRDFRPKFFLICTIMCTNLSGKTALPLPMLGYDTPAPALRYFFIQYENLQ